MNDLALELSAASRATLRDAIKRHPSWPDYRAEHDTDMAQMTTKEAIFRCCDALAIDIHAVLSGTYEGAHDLAIIIKDEPKPKVALKAVSRPAQVSASATDQLAAAIAAIAAIATQNAAPVDMEQVRAEIDAGLLRTEATLSDAIAESFKALERRIADQPLTRIELKRGDEIKPIDGHHHPKFATLLRVMSARQSDTTPINVWISGPAGSGKTHGAKMAAKALSLAFHYNGALSMPHELLGFIDAAGNYHRTPFREAYEHGGVYLFDEVDGSDNSALLALNAALANGAASFPDGQIARHKDCFVIATANTWGLGATADYVGRSKIDAAFLSRFPVRLAWDYDEKLEQQISGDADFAKRVQKARGKARKAGIKILIDPRASMAGAALIATGMSADEAAEITYLANLSAEQRTMVEG